MSDWPKIVQDPVHGIIPFQKDETDVLLLDLINAKEFQRLRRIKQLGMSDLVFPGAGHTRFAHSIGVMHTARRMLDRLHTVAEGGVTAEQRRLVLVAALLHDVGHGPFSHTFESVTDESHEARTIEIFTSGVTQVNSILVKQDKELPSKLELFFKSVEDKKLSDYGIPEFFAQIVSSQLDADRFDYLLRDSMFTGVDYGRYDLDWMIEHLFVDAKNDRLFLSQKAFNAAEQYISARYYMYRSVYFHKTTRAAEVMLRLIFRRYKFLLKGAGMKPEDIAHGAPSVVRDSFQGTIPLDQYLLLDEHILTAFFVACRSSKDPVLAALASGLLDRRLYKAIDATDATGAAPAAIGKFTTAATAYLKSTGYEPEYSLADDTPADTPYKPYDPASEKPAAQIYVRNSLGKIVELSQASGLADELNKRYQLLRYYFPPETQAKMLELWQDANR